MLSDANGVNKQMGKDWRTVGTCNVIGSVVLLSAVEQAVRRSRACQVQSMHWN